VERHSTDYLVPYLNQRAYPSLTRHFAPSALHTSPYFSPAACGSFAYLACVQKQRKRSSLRPALAAAHADLGSEDARACGLPVWIQYGAVENLHGDIERLVERMRADGVQVDVERVEGGVHLDAGIAFALGERGEGSSWVRLCEAVRGYVGSGPG
jgi:acetyl esterase/lipase